jgi:hypothetical protein
MMNRILNIFEPAVVEKSVVDLISTTSLDWIMRKKVQTTAKISLF